MTTTITYTCGSDCGRMAGMTLTGGKPTTHNDEPAVMFDSQRIGRKRITPMLRVAGRPDLAELVDEYNAELVDERNKAKQANERANKQINDAIPVGHTRVKHERTWIDQYVDSYETSDGESIDPSLVTVTEVEGTKIYTAPIQVVKSLADAAERRKLAQADERERNAEFLRHRKEPCPYCGTYCCGSCRVR